MHKTVIIIIAFILCKLHNLKSCFCAIYKELKCS
nr:MAG TPA: hypothetical protein [Caudoviricetes sp.]